MGKKEKLFRKMILSQKNIKFSNFILILKAFGFLHQRTNGSHQIYFNRNIQISMNVQDSKDMAKPYQVRDFLKLVENYKLDFKE